MAFVGTSATQSSPASPRRKHAQRRVLRAVRGTASVPAASSRASVPVTMDLRLVDAAILDWHNTAVV